MRISDWSSDVCLPISDLAGPGETRAFREGKRTVQLLQGRSRRVLRHSQDRATAAQAVRCPRLGYRSASRSDERRVGKECVSTCRSRLSQSHSIKKTTTPQTDPLSLTHKHQKNA